MTKHEKLAGSAIAASVVLIAIYPNSVASSILAVVSCLLYGFLAFIDQKETHLEKQVRELNDKVQSLMLAKGFGR